MEFGTKYFEKQHLNITSGALMEYFRDFNESYIEALKNVAPRWQIENLREVNKGSYESFRQMLEKYRIAQNEKAVKEAELRLKNEELNYARKVQLSMLPQKNICFPDLQITGFMQTATEVGGDYYDFFELDSDNYAVILGDATGHGVGAGIMVGMTKSALIQSLKRFSPEKDSLSGLMITLNATLWEAIRQKGLGICLSIVLINRSTGEIKIVSSGVPYPYHYRFREGTLYPLEISGPPLGLLSRINPQNMAIILEKGDSLVLFSDGFPERMDREGQIWDYNNLETALLSSLKKGIENEEVIARIKNENDRFAAGLENNDDMTMVVIRKLL